MRASMGVTKVFVANRLYTVDAVTFDRMSKELNNYSDEVRAVQCDRTASRSRGLHSCPTVGHRFACDSKRDATSRPTFSVPADKMGVV